MKSHTHTHTDNFFDTPYSDRVLDKTELFNQRIYNTILDASLSSVCDFPICANICASLSVTSVSMLAKSPLALKLAEIEASNALEKHKCVNFGSIKSLVKAKSLIHKIICDNVNSTCARVNVNPKRINSERLKATLTFYLAYSATRQALMQISEMG